MKIFNKLFDNLAAAIFLAVMVMVTGQIFFRYVLSIGVPWTEELSRMLFIYLAFFGGAIAVRQGSMIAVDTLLLILKGKAKLIMSLIIHVFSLIYVVLMFCGSVYMVVHVWPTTFATLTWMSNGWLYVPLAIGFGLMSLWCIPPILQTARSVFAGGKA